MKKVISLLIISTFVFFSCGTMNYKKTIFLVDAPRDIEVFKDNKPLEVASLVLGSYESGGTRTVYKYPGFRSKLKKSGNKYVLKVGDQTVDVTVNTKRGVKILIIEGLMTCGIFTVVDLITGGDREPSPKFLDVPALFNNEKVRNDKVLKKAAYDSYR